MLGAITADRWRNNWRAISPPGAAVIELTRSPAKRADAIVRIRGLSSGAPVVLIASAPWAVRRCKRVAHETQVELEREYLAFPTATAPAYLVEDVRATIRLFAETILVAPPRAAASIGVQSAVHLLRALNPWRLIRLLAPGRVAVGRKS
jgi:hypothetical protein